jgi:hypothetical protein
MHEAATTPPLAFANIDADRLAAEDLIVAELERLGIRYLSRDGGDAVERVRPPAILLADLMQQPSGRVREAVIAVLLAHPGYSRSVTAALARLPASSQLELRFFYTAAVLLQRQYAGALRPHMNERWRWLPDLFSEELGLPDQGAWPERLARLGALHRARSGSAVNWAGTYDNVARKLIRRWDMERRWNP